MQHSYLDVLKESKLKGWKMPPPPPPLLFPPPPPPSNEGHTQALYNPKKPQLPSIANITIGANFSITAGEFISIVHTQTEIYRKTITDTLMELEITKKQLTDVKKDCEEIQKKNEVLETNKSDAGRQIKSIKTEFRLLQAEYEALRKKELEMEYQQNQKNAKHQDEKVGLLLTHIKNKNKIIDLENELEDERAVVNVFGVGDKVQAVWYNPLEVKKRKRDEEEHTFAWCDAEIMTVGCELEELYKPGVTHDDSAIAVNVPTYDIRWMDGTKLQTKKRGQYDIRAVSSSEIEDSDC